MSFFVKLKTLSTKVKVNYNFSHYFSQRITNFNLLAKSINQVIYYFLKNCFTFLKKIWMLQVRKSSFCGISTNFFRCCFMSETQVLMAVSDFSDFFLLGIISWKGASFFNWGLVSGIQLGIIYSLVGILVIKRLLHDHHVTNHQGQSLYQTCFKE